MIAKEDAIWIEHGHDFKYESVTQDTSLSFITEHHIYDAFHGEATVGLTWVNSGREDDALAISYLVL